MNTGMFGVCKANDCELSVCVRVCTLYFETMLVPLARAQPSAYLQRTPASGTTPSRPLFAPPEVGSFKVLSSNYLNFRGKTLRNFTAVCAAFGYTAV